MAHDGPCVFVDIDGQLQAKQNMAHNFLNLNVRRRILTHTKVDNAQLLQRYRGSAVITFFKVNQGN